MTINDALQLHHAGRLAEAERAYRQVLAAQPKQYHALHFLGVLKAQTGDMAASAELIAQSLALHAQNPLAEFHLAEALRRLGRRADAADHYRTALDLDPAFVPALAGLAECLLAMRKPGEALAAADRGLAASPGDPVLMARRGDALLRLERRADARQAYDKALSADPKLAPALVGKAQSLIDTGSLAEALSLLDAAAAADPAAAEPLVTRAAVLAEMGRRDEALAVCQQALIRDPANENAYFHMGCQLLDAGAAANAVAAFDSALALQSDFAEALYNRAFALDELNRSEEALQSCDKVLALDPDSGLAAGKSYLIRARRCDWSGWSARRTAIEELVRRGKKVDPYILALAFDDPSLLHGGAKTWAQPGAMPMPPRPLSADRLRIAYISPNFHNHPVAHLAVEMFEAHDRSRFETFGFCVASGLDTPIRQRLKSAFDHFIETGRASNREVAELLAAHRIDIAVDLAGYTADGRTGALRYRPCPIAVTWLGYPGTTGAPYVDYLIADPVIIPPGAEGFYSEKIVRLPESYMPRDAGEPAAATPSRRALGLPEDGLVFSAFNAAHKFTPEIFSVWMRLLQAVDGSVLWLNCQDGKTRANLVDAAQGAGVDDARIVFAPRVAERGDHLARLAAADLFLDTLPYGAHSTANDFLFMGVPVLTVAGQSFATRVAAAMLTALDLPELIAPDLAAYEETALALARQPQRLAALRARVAAGRSARLFDPVRFCRDMEYAFASMAERARAGLAAEGFAVPRQ